MAYYKVKIVSSYTGRFEPRDIGKWIGPFGLVKSKSLAQVMDEGEKQEIQNGRYSSDLQLVRVPKPKGYANPGIEPRKWIPVHAVRFNQDGSVSLLGEHSAANPAKSSIRKRAYRVAERTAYAAQYGKKAARKLVHKAIKRKRRY